MRKINSLLIIMIMLCSMAYARDLVQVKGSDTMINMVQKLAEVYMQKNPGSAIAVTGGGSGTGVSALINKRCDIANSSRLMKGSEIIQAQQAGVDPKRVVIALDGLCFIVNPSNPVKTLTVAQLGKIFAGKITNWSEVGGANQPITLYGRQSNSGTYDFVKEFVIKGDYSNKMRSMNGNSQIVEGIRADVSAIGYVGIGYVREASGAISVIEVSAKPGAKAYSPLNMDAVNKGLYPVIRPLNQYVNGMPDGVLKSFIAFELSPEGQKIIEQEGFIAIPKEYVQMNAGNVGL